MRLEKCFNGISFIVFSNLIHSQSRRYVTRYTPESVEDVLQKPDEGNPQVRFCEGAHSNLGAITPERGALWALLDMYGEIAATFVPFVSFIPFVFKTGTRVCRSYLQTRSYCRKLQKTVAVWYMIPRISFTS